MIQLGVLALTFAAELVLLVVSVVSRTSGWAQGTCAVFAVVVGTALLARIMHRNAE